MFSSCAIHTAKNLWGPHWEGAFAMQIQDRGPSCTHYDAFQVFRKSFSQRQIQEIPPTEKSLCKLAAQGHWTAVTELAQKLEESMIMGSNLYNVSHPPSPPACFTNFPSELLKGTVSAASTVGATHSIDLDGPKEGNASSSLRAMGGAESEDREWKEEDEFWEAVGEWLQEHLPAIRSFLQYLLYHPRLLLADPDLSVWHREWINRLPFRTAQVQAWWKMKQYKRSVPLLSDFTEYAEEEWGTREGGGEENEKRMERTSASPSSSTSFCQTFLHPSTGCSIIPFSLRYMNALLPFYLDPNSEEAVKRLSALLQRIKDDKKEGGEEDRNETSEMEKEVQNLLRLAHLFIPVSSWYVHSRSHPSSVPKRRRSSSSTRREGCLHSDGESFPGNQMSNPGDKPAGCDSCTYTPPSSHLEFSPKTHFSERGIDWQRQAIADSLYVFLKAEAESLVESRLITRRQRLLSALAFVRYSQRRVSLSMDAYRSWFKEEEKKWAVTISRVAMKDSPARRNDARFKNVPMLSPIPRVLPLYSLCSVFHKDKCNKGMNASSCMVARSIQRHTNPSLLFSLAPVIFVLFRLLRQACFCLQLGNRFSANEIQICMAQLAHHWGKLGRRQHKRRVGHLNRMMAEFNTSVMTKLEAKEAGFSLPSFRSLCKKFDLALSTSRSLSFVFDQFLCMLENLLEGFAAMSSERFEMGIHQFSQISEHAQEVILEWMEEYTRITRINIKEETEESEGNMKNHEIEKINSDCLGKGGDGNLKIFNEFQSQPSSPASQDALTLFSSFASFPTPQLVEEKILDPWIKALEKEEGAVLQAIHRLRTYAQVSHITSLLYTSFTTNEASAMTISQPKALSTKISTQLRKYLTINPCGLVSEDSFLFVASRWFLFAGEGRRQTNELMDVMELMNAERAALPNIDE